ncbi:MAG TPA: phosphohydrolase [Chloroflexi bacterium]|jgi:hypothetical protein|nr:phosphohydrolase [Chloroflexota bacterium]
MRIPTIAQAEAMLAEAERMNPGPWVAHNRVAGRCARAIAAACDDMDDAAACVLGLLHDIGRRFGVCDMRHTILGYRFMQERGFDDSARICLTHSFPYRDIASYNGHNDCTEGETEFLRAFIDQAGYDDYDRLIQLCDAVSLPDGATWMEKRLVDVALRRGVNDLTVPKWRAFLQLKTYFDEKTGGDIYRLIGVVGA